MKNFTKIIGLFAIASLLVSCSASYDAAAYEDDVFYNPYRETRLDKKKDRLERKLAKANGDVNSYKGDVTESAKVAPIVPATITDENGDQYQGNVTDDYYDYSYSAKIRRFYHDNDSLSYYDDYYTDSYYYDGNPSGNTYVTNNYNSDPWHSNWNFSYGIGFGYGWGYPYYGGGYPYYGGGYWSGYNNGYYNGYWDGYYAGGGYYGGGGYYPDYGYGNDNYGSGYYGHRSGGGSSNGTVRSDRDDKIVDRGTNGSAKSPSITKTPNTIRSGAAAGVATGATVNNGSSKSDQLKSKSASLNQNDKSVGIASGDKASESSNVSTPDRRGAATTGPAKATTQATRTKVTYQPYNGATKTDSRTQNNLSTKVSTSTSATSSGTRPNSTYSKRYTKPSTAQTPSRARSTTSTSPSRSNTSYNPANSRTRSSSARSYTPSRSSSSTRSYTPSRSSSSSSRSSTYRPSNRSSSSTQKSTYRPSSSSRSSNSSSTKSSSTRSSSSKSSYSPSRSSSSSSSSRGSYSPSRSSSSSTSSSRSSSSGRSSGGGRR